MRVNAKLASSTVCSHNEDVVCRKLPWDDHTNGLDHDGAVIEWQASCCRKEEHCGVAGKYLWCDMEWILVRDVWWSSVVDTGAYIISRIIRLTQG